MPFQTHIQPYSRDKYNKPSVASKKCMKMKDSQNPNLDQMKFKKIKNQILGDCDFGLGAIMSATVSSMNPRKKFID